MGVILGTMTHVIIGSVDTGFQSINWNINSQPNRLWQLGRWQPYGTQVGVTITISVTAYAGALGTQSLAAATACIDSSAVRTITLNAAACDPTDAINETFANMYITSYSYSKGDPVGFGTESWSFQKWLDSDDYINSNWSPTNNGIIQMPAPSYVLQGITEGNWSGDDQTIVGLAFYAGPYEVIGQQGSVSAGIPGIGNADTTHMGIVQSIGGGSIEAGGKIGQASASIPHQPLYVG